MCGCMRRLWASAMRCRKYMTRHCSSGGRASGRRGLEREMGRGRECAIVRTARVEAFVMAKALKQVPTTSCCTFAADTAGDDAEDSPRPFFSFLIHPLQANETKFQRAIEQSSKACRRVIYIMLHPNIFTRKNCWEPKNKTYFCAIRLPSSFAKLPSFRSSQTPTAENRQVAAARTDRLGCTEPGATGLPQCQRALGWAWECQK